jgi:hypothetical protein
MRWEPRGVYKRFSGFISFQEYARSQEQVLSDPRIDDMDYVINDFLAISGYSLTEEQAEYLAAFNRGSSYSNPRLRVAYVTTDKRALLLIKLVSGLSSLKIKAFPTLEAARVWAGGAG